MQYAILQYSSHYLAILAPVFTSSDFLCQTVILQTFQTTASTSDAIITIALLYIIFGKDSRQVTISRQGLLLMAMPRILFSLSTQVYWMSLAIPAIIRSPIW